MWRWTEHIVPVLLLAVLGGCGETEPAPRGPGGLVPVVLQMDWYPQPEHGGFYQALLDGLYRDAGMEVEIRSGANITNIPQMVATARIQFAVGTSDNLLIAVSRGIPLQGLFPYFQRDPQCVIFHRSSGIESLQDLDGRTVMMNPGLNYAHYLQRSLGIRFNLVPLDYSLARFLTDPAFVQQCFVTNEPFYVAEQGVDAGVIPLSRSGYAPYRLVYTNAALVQEQPELVRAFVAASLEGWRRYVEGDGARVHERLAALNPQQTAEFMVWTKRAINEHGLTHGDVEAGETLGRLSRQRLNRQLEQLDALDFLEGPVDLERAFAFEVLEQAAPRLADRGE